MNPPIDPRSRVPSVDKVAGAASRLPGLKTIPHARLVEASREALERVRNSLESGAEIPSLEEIVERVWQIIEGGLREGIRPVVNATGVVLHTNLGRAVLPAEAMEAIGGLDGCCSLQIDLDSGERGRRDTVIEKLLQRITGAEAATVVNNNAAATLLVLAALCRDREVVVSRGQLIEIGGSFRLPDVIVQSGTRMVEVGTTNKTHLRDYENAITENTAALLRVNPSNYRIVGFTKQVSTAELVRLKEGRDLIVMDDLGCGALLDLSRIGLPKEPTVQDSLGAGADVVLFSGDKLIGGPQAGIIVGKKDLIARIRRHPLARALRVGKFTVAALEATLKLFLDPDALIGRNPTLRMLALRREQLRPRAEALANRLAPLIDCEAMEGHSACGGGALPDAPLATIVVALKPQGMSASDLARRLRLGEPSVVTRVQDDTVQLDVRTLLDGDEERIETALQKAMSKE